MVKQDPEKLLNDSLINSRLNDGFIDVDTIEFKPLYKIVECQLYDSAIDWSFFWHIFIVSALSVADFENKSRALTSVEKRQIVSKIHKLAAGVPYEYSFYYQLPDDYPGSFQDLDIVKLIKIDQKKFNSLISHNKASGTGLIKALNEKNLDSIIPKVGEKYIYIQDKGLVNSGEYAFLESNYSPDRLVGLYYSLHVVEGTLDTNSIRRHVPTPRVFNSNNHYNSNFKNPIKSHRAATMTFKNEPKKVDVVNKIFQSISTPQSISSKENARIQICNALYWYLEFLNTDDWSLQLVFLVSVVDSLFPTRRSSITKKNITPTVMEKAPVIAAAISASEIDKDECINSIEKLFYSRNDVIHGKIEIHGYRKSTLAKKSDYENLIKKSENLVREYIVSRIRRYIAS